MAKTKGTDIVGLRKIIQAKGVDFEREFIKDLPEYLSKMYQSALHNTWSPVEKQTELYLLAASMLFPDDPDSMLKLGKAMAEKSFSTVYKVFLRIPTKQYIMARTAQVWSTYYDHGRACTENFTPTSVDFVVRDFPDLPDKLRELICGHLVVILEMTGSRNIRVQRADIPTKEWRWLLTWD
jgi:hypothetical protein